jgi:hypothetical protein
MGLSYKVYACGCLSNLSRDGILGWDTRQCSTAMGPRDWHLEFGWYTSREAEHADSTLR